MSLAILTDRSGDVVTFKGMRWWAERGMIHSEDVDSGEYKVQTVRTTLFRLKALNDMIGNSRTGKGYHHPSEVRELQRYIDQICLLCQKAQKQGMPDNDAHAKQMAQEHKAKRHASAMVVLPGLLSTM